MVKRSNPTTLNSDDDLAKLGGQILDASIELDDALQAAARELIETRVDPALRIGAALRLLSGANNARRELLDLVISWSAEAGYPLKF